MKLRLKFILFGMIALLRANLFGQQTEQWNHDIGINLLQIPATTIDLTYELSNNPRYSMVVNPGYTIHYASPFDFINFIIVPNYKCGNYGYSMKTQTGGFLKLGGKFNLRKELEKKNYFYLGSFLTNSLIHEKTDYENMNEPDSELEYFEHTMFIVGLTAAIGYNFKISNKISSDFGLHLSMPSKNHKDMFGYTNYIPGMGFLETCGGEWLFPMLVLNLKYKLNDNTRLPKYIALIVDDAKVKLSFDFKVTSNVIVYNEQLLI